MPDPATRSTRRLGAVPAAVLVAAALWEIAATRCQSTAVPGDDDWAKAAAIVRENYRPGDLIVFAPRWADPIGRLHLGDLIPLEMAGRMDAERYSRIWELTIRGAVAPEVVGLVPVEDFAGPVHVLRYERKAPKVVFDLAATPPPGARVDLVEVAFEPHRCVVVPTPPIRPYLWELMANLDQLPEPARTRAIRGAVLLPELPAAYAVPKPERTGKRLVVPQLPLGKQLAVKFGIADVFTRRDERRPVELQIEMLGLTSPPPVSAEIDRWQSYDLFQPASVARDVTVVLRWQANPGELTGNKLVCIAAEVRE